MLKFKRPTPVRKRFKVTLSRFAPGGRLVSGVTTVNCLERSLKLDGLNNSKSNTDVNFFIEAFGLKFNSLSILFK